MKLKAEIKSHRAPRRWHGSGLGTQIALRMKETTAKIEAGIVTSLSLMSLEKRTGRSTRIWTMTRITKQRKRCWWRNSTYRLTCRRCEVEGTKTTYTGETKNSNKRLKQHRDGLRRGQRDNVLHQHQEDKHNGEQMSIKDFKTEILGQHSKVIERQVAEDYLVAKEVKERDRNTSRTIVLNSRNEFHQAAMTAPLRTVPLFL